MKCAIPGSEAGEQVGGVNGEDRIERADEELRRREEERGATLDDVLSGEAGRRWIREACGGDVELAEEVFRRVHPNARFFSLPGAGANGRRR